jgi:hypothetical protein
VHFRVKLNRRRNHDHVEDAMAHLEHGAIVIEDLHAACIQPPVLLLAHKCCWLRITGANEFCVSTLLESRDGVVMRPGEAAHSNDADPDGRLHAPVPVFLIAAKKPLRLTFRSLRSE